MYKIFGPEESRIIVRVEDMAMIPMKEDNSDYQSYLLWVEEGNVAEEFDFSSLNQEA